MTHEVGAHERAEATDGVGEGPSAAIDAGTDRKPAVQRLLDHVAGQGRVSLPTPRDGDGHRE